MNAFGPFNENSHTSSYVVAVIGVLVSPSVVAKTSISTAFEVVVSRSQTVELEISQHMWIET